MNIVALLVLFHLPLFKGYQENISNSTELQHDCEKNQTCECTTIWDSHCYCKDAELEKSSINQTLQHNTTSNSSLCNCNILWRECWNFNSSLKSQYYHNNTLLCNQLKKNTDEMISTLLIISTSDPSSIQIINTMKEILEVLSQNVSLQILFNPLGYENEKEIDTILLCSIKYYPKYYQYFPFIACMVKYSNYSEIFTLEEYTKSCAKGHLLNYDIIENCSKSSEGSILYQNNQIIANNYPPQTLVTNLDWYNMKKSEKTARDYLVDICNGPSIPNRPDLGSFPWWIFTFLACIVLTLLIVIWIAKSDVEKIISSLFCTIFYEIEDKNEENRAEEVLRLWQIGGLGGDEEENEDVPLPPVQITNTKPHEDEGSDEDNIFIPTKEENS